MISKLFKPSKTVDSALAHFSKALNDLQEVARENENKATKHLNEATIAQSNYDSAKLEAERANTVHQKISALLDGNQ